MKEIMLLPCLLALGVGLSLNNARAVLEAVFNHKSDFTRTPKYGIERKSQPWRNCRYMPLKSVLPVAEMFFAVYFHLLRLVRDRAPPIPFGPILAYVSIWVSLRLVLLRHSMATEIQLEQRQGA